MYHGCCCRWSWFKSWLPSLSLLPYHDGGSCQGQLYFTPSHTTLTPLSSWQPWKLKYSVIVSVPENDGMMISNFLRGCASFPLKHWACSSFLHVFITASTYYSETQHELTHHPAWVTEWATVAVEQPVLWICILYYVYQNDDDDDDDHSVREMRWRRKEVVLLVKKGKKYPLTRGKLWSLCIHEFMPPSVWESIVEGCK